MDSKGPSAPTLHPNESELCLEAFGERDTARLGGILATLLPEGTIVGLEGTLGSGKTRLVQAVAAAAGCHNHLVVSPTFVLVQQYFGRRTITHIDAYRVGSIREFLELGVEEYFEGPGLVFIEWADRVTSALPSQRLAIIIHITGETRRQFVLRSSLKNSPWLLAEIAKAWGEAR